MSTRLIRVAWRVVAELHAPDIGGAERILRTLDDYLAAERSLERLGGSVDPHLVGVLLFAITHLQALATHVQQPDATEAKATRELRPYVDLLAASLTTVKGT